MTLYMFRTVRLSETCRVSCQNKFVKLVHLVGFITNKFFTMRGDVNVKSVHFLQRIYCIEFFFVTFLMPLSQSIVL